MKLSGVLVSKIFFVSIFFHSLSVYFLKTGVFGSALIIFSILTLSIYFVIGSLSVSKQDFPFILSTLFYCLIGFIYVFASLMTPEKKLSYFISYLLPLYTVLATRTLSLDISFFILLIKYFLITQLVVVSGQIATYTLGFGFPVSEEYMFMLTGTFTNSNDLAAIVLTCILSILMIEVTTAKINSNGLIWVLALILIILTASRTAILLYCVLILFSKSFSFKRTIFYFILLTILIYVFTIFFPLEIYFGSGGGGFSERVFERVSSIYDIIQNGVEHDGSVSIRTKSYSYFLAVFSELGFGTIEYEDYSRYFYKADFDYSLVSKNPHSLLIELAYWQGFIGVTALSFLLITSIVYFSEKISFFCLNIISFLLITAIPSSSLLLYPIVSMYFLIVIKAGTPKDVNFFLKKAL